MNEERIRTAAHVVAAVATVWAAVSWNIFYIVAGGGIVFMVAGFLAMQPELDAPRRFLGALMFFIGLGLLLLRIAIPFIRIF